MAKQRQGFRGCVRTHSSWAWLPERLDNDGRPTVVVLKRISTLNYEIMYYKQWLGARILLHIRRITYPPPPEKKN